MIVVVVVIVYGCWVCSFDFHSFDCFVALVLWFLSSLWVQRHQREELITRTQLQLTLSNFQAICNPTKTRTQSRRKPLFHRNTTVIWRMVMNRDDCLETLLSQLFCSVCDVLVQPSSQPIQPYPSHKRQRERQYLWTICHFKAELSYPPYQNHYNRHISAVVVLTTFVLFDVPKEPKGY